MLRFIRLATLSLFLAVGPLLVIWVLLQGETVYYWVLLGGAVIWPVLLMLWYLLFGKKPFLQRFKRTGIFFAILLLLLFLPRFLLRYEGSTSGASMPKFSWRWTKAEVPVPTTEVLTSALADNAPALAAAAGDSLQFLGPDRDGTWPKLSFSPNWKTNPPKEIWRRPVGQGWSSFAVAGKKAITQEQFGDIETVVCYELLSGKILWTHRDEKAGFLNANKENQGAIMAGAGPRSTPTVHAGKIYTQGAAGIVNCLDLETGILIWTQNFLKKNKEKIPKWGQSTSPLVIADLNMVIVSGSDRSGSTLLASRLDSGKPIWKYAGHGASYSSPRLLKILGIRQIVSVNAKDLSGVDPATGKELWHYDWPGGNPKVSQPALIGKSRILATASYSAGSPLIEISRNANEWKASQIWKTVKMKTKFSSVSIRGEYAYGLDEGRLACIDLATGKKVWKKQKFGFGQQLFIGGDYLLIQTEPGEVVIGKISPKGFIETGRIAALSSMTWNAPTLAGRLLLVRNDQEAVCYLLPE